MNLNNLIVLNTKVKLICDIYFDKELNCLLDKKCPIAEECAGKGLTGDSYIKQINLKAEEIWKKQKEF